MTTTQPIQVVVNGTTYYECRTWSQAIVYIAMCKLRQHWPFDRRRKRIRFDGVDRRTMR